MRSERLEEDGRVRGAKRGERLRGRYIRFMSDMVQAGLSLCIRGLKLTESNDADLDALYVYGWRLSDVALHLEAELAAE